MKISNKNIFLSCSYTNAKNLSVFDKEQRLSQLLDTIKSCSSIEDHVNVIAEGSSLSEEQVSILSQTKAVVLNCADNINIHGNKQYGSLLLWQKALETLEISDDSDVYFLAGRYRLANNFSVKDFQPGPYVFKQHWHSPGRGGWYGTQLFKVAGSKITLFLDALRHAEKYIHRMDIECSLYRSFADLQITPIEIPMVNCIGENGLTGNESLH